MTEATKRDIAADLRAGKGHYVTLPTHNYGTRIYQIKRSPKTGAISVFLGLGRGWTMLHPGMTIYSDRDSFAV